MPLGQTYTDVHVNKPLSNMSIAYFQDASNFVSGRFFTNLPVSNASDTYTVYPQGYFNRIHNTKRAEDGKANRIGYKAKDASYSCQEDALRILITDKARANADGQRNLDFEATHAVTNAILVGREQNFADTFLSATSTWSQVETVAGADKWDVDTSNPITKILDIVKTMTLSTGGMKPNKGLMSFDTYLALREHPDMLERVRYGGRNEKPAKVTLGAIADLFELDEIMIIQSVVNAAPDGIEDPTTGEPLADNQFISSGAFLTVHAPKGVGLFSATAGLTFLWNQYIAHGLEAGPSTRKYRPQDGTKGEYIEVEMAMDQRIVAPDLGHLLLGLV